MSWITRFEVILLSLGLSIEMEPWHFTISKIFPSRTNIKTWNDGSISHLKFFGKTMKRNYWHDNVCAWYNIYCKISTWNNFNAAPVSEPLFLRQHAGGNSSIKIAGVWLRYDKIYSQWHHDTIVCRFNCSSHTSIQLVVNNEFCRFHELLFRWVRRCKLIRAN